MPSENFFKQTFVGFRRPVPFTPAICYANRYSAASDAPHLKSWLR